MDFMPLIPLSEDQKQKLQNLAQDAPELLTHRARLILAYAAGKPTLQAASEAGISRGRARYWKRQFLARGMHIFDTEPSTTGCVAGSNNLVSSLDDLSLIQSEADRSLVEQSDQKQDIPYPQPRQSIGVKPEDTLAEDSLW